MHGKGGSIRTNESLNIKSFSESRPLTRQKIPLELLSQQWFNLYCENPKLVRRANFISLKLGYHPEDARLDNFL